MSGYQARSVFTLNIVTYLKPTFYEVRLVFIIYHFTNKKIEIQYSAGTLAVAELVNGKAGIQIQAG